MPPPRAEAACSSSGGARPGSRGQQRQNRSIGTRDSVERKNEYHCSLVHGEEARAPQAAGGAPDEGTRWYHYAPHEAGESRHGAVAGFVEADGYSDTVGET